MGLGLGVKSDRREECLQQNTMRDGRLQITESSENKNSVFDSNDDADIALAENPRSIWSDVFQQQVTLRMEEQRCFDDDDVTADAV